MDYHRYQVLPWIVVFIVVLCVLGFVAWLGYDGWTSF